MARQTREVKLNLLNYNENYSHCHLGDNGVYVFCNRDEQLIYKVLERWRFRGDKKLESIVGKYSLAE